MPPAYVASPGAAVKADSDSLIVSLDGKPVGSIELQHCSALIVLGRASVTTPAVRSLLRLNIPLLLCTRTGRFLGRLTPPTSNAVFARLAQARLLADPPTRLQAARRLVRAKLDAMAALLAAPRDPNRAVAQARRSILDTIGRLHMARSTQALLGHEGAASAAYWNAFPCLLKSPLAFSGRKRRPPPDPVNALLSFGYSLLLAHTTAALDAAGLDPFIGIYHQTSPRRPALALDLIEPFRHACVDRLVRSLINARQFSDSDFHRHKGGCYLTRQALPRFILAFEQALIQPPLPCLVPAGADAPATTRDALHLRIRRLADWLNRPTPSDAAAA